MPSCLDRKRSARAFHIERIQAGNMADSTITIIVKPTAGGEKFQVVASTDDTIAELKTKVRGRSNVPRKTLAPCRVL